MSSIISLFGFCYILYKSYLVYSVSTFLFDITLFSMITDSTILISAHSKVSIENLFFCLRIFKGFEKKNSWVAQKPKHVWSSNFRQFWKTDIILNWIYAQNTKSMPNANSTILSKCVHLEHHQIFTTKVLFWGLSEFRNQT